MTKIRLYRLKDREVREIGEKDDVRLRCLKRAGFEVGELPPAPKPKEPVVEKPLPPTEGEEVDGAEEGEPVLAKHAPIGVPLQEVKDAEAETDAEDESPAEDAADDESTEEVDGAEDPAEEEAVEEAEDEPEGKEEDGKGDGTDEEGSEDE